MRSPVKSITLVRGEGPTAQCGHPKTVTSWLDANAQLRLWSNTAPETGGYDKCDFTVEWENGARYVGRYDLKHWRVEAPDLLAHIVGMAYFYMGVQTPAHMTQEKHRRFLLSDPGYATEARNYRRLLERNDLGVETVPASQFEELN